MRLWKRLFYAALFLLIILIIAAVLVFLNRNLVYEATVKRALAKRGYDAAFIIESATTDAAKITGITLGRDGAPVFSAKSLDITYDWEELRQGIIRSAVVEAPVLAIEINAQGKIISDWMPENSGAEAKFPSGGVRINNANVNVISPYGNLTAGGDVTLRGGQSFVADLELESAGFTVGDHGGGLMTGHINIEREGAAVSFSQSVLHVTDLSLTAKDKTRSRIRAADITLDGKFERSDDGGHYSYDGAAGLKVSNFNHGMMTAAKTTLSLEGQFAYDGLGKRLLPSRYEVDIEGGNFAFSAPDLRRELAHKLSMHKALSAAPIARQFNASFTKDIEALLRGADWSTRLDMDFTAAGYSAALKAPLIIDGGARKIILTKTGGSPALIYKNNGLTLRAGLRLTGARDLTLRNITVTGASPNGGLWKDIGSVSAVIETASEWREGASRLGPFSAALDYKAGARGHLNITSALDYDGPLIGSDFIGLRANGALSLAVKAGGQAVSFTSSDVITADQVVTHTGYDLRDVSLYLDGDAPILTRSGGLSHVALKARNIAAIARSTEKQTRFDVKASHAVISGDILGQEQSWTIDAQTADVKTGDGKTASAPMVSAALTHRADSEWGYDINSPVFNMRAGPLSLKDMDVRMEGSDSDLTLYYAKGVVTLDGSTLPPLSVTGQGRLENGRVTGAAQTALPRAPQFPIFADYVFENGVGSATLNVPQFIWKPGDVQPQALAPALRGKLAQVRGESSALVTLDYIAGQPIKSRGTVTLKDMDIGTLVGPFTGVNAALEFDSLYPLVSRGRQTITMTGFDPGVPLGNGSVVMEVVTGGFNLIDARWPIGDGAIAVRPALWSTEPGAVNTITVAVEDVSLGDVVSRLGNEDLYASGLISGTLPIVIDGVNLKVKDGRLLVADGGVVRIQHKGLNAAGDANETAKMAVDALKDLRYEELSLDINGPLDGDITLGIIFTGHNPDVLYGSDFLFRVNVEGELLNIARNIVNNADVQALVSSIENAPR
ncbi:MAG: YdbH domain-containing protein [Robiginitomaculum sp.]